MICPKCATKCIIKVRLLSELYQETLYLCDNKECTFYRVARIK
jgi:hypothetical protein